MSIKRQDERHNGDTVKELKELFDNEETEQGKEGAPRMRIVGDLRTPPKKPHG
ncbi:hypothetical protein [Sciscionella marina]|uniref:hypothetical protein n=1 Tax=Sciscionella marina TaxID=508770 RepID=UPI00036618B9|nr:hypothetical protein [Sciscionella marina]